MLLNFEQIVSIATGLARAKATPTGGAELFRFTEEQENYYERTNADFYKKSLSSSGICLDFLTDGTQLELSVSIEQASSRGFFCIEFFVDGQRADELKNFSEAVPLDKTCLKNNYPLGDFSKTVKLGNGKKRVTVYLPWTVKTTVQSLKLKNASYLTPAKRQKTLLIFGDSITQGYDALYPTQRYACALAQYLNAEERCKGIGAERFTPAIAEAKEDVTPDYIYVAYGTNDWSKSPSFVDVVGRCVQFFKNIKSNYPTARLIVQTPLWRTDCATPTAVGEFEALRAKIKEIAYSYGAFVVDGDLLIPHKAEYFSDEYLHPNPAGFKKYAENLISILKQNGIS